MDRNQIENMTPFKSRMLDVLTPQPGPDDLLRREDVANYVECVGYAMSASVHTSKTLPCIQINRQHRWSSERFGPPSHRGPAGPLKHLKKEVEEALESPGDLEEYVDLLFLVLDAAWRAGFSTSSLLRGHQAKLTINEARNHPDWRGADPNEPIEHIREE